MTALLYVLLGLVFGFYVGYRIGSEKKKEIIHTLGPKQTITNLDQLKAHNEKHADAFDLIKEQFNL